MIDDDVVKEAKERAKIAKRVPRVKFSLEEEMILMDAQEKKMPLKEVQRTLLPNRTYAAVSKHAWALKSIKLLKIGDEATKKMYADAYLNKLYRKRARCEADLERTNKTIAMLEAKKLKQDEEAK